MKTFLPVCLALTLMVLSLALVSCNNPTGGSDPAVSGYRVVYHAGEGRGVPPYPQTVLPGTIIELPGQETMTHPTGKVLSGWSTGGATYNPFGRYEVKGNVDFTAQWSAQ